MVIDFSWNQWNFSFIISFMAISTQSTDLLRYFSEYSKFFLEIDIQEQGVGGSYCDYIANLSPINWDWIGLTGTELGNINDPVEVSEINFLMNGWQRESRSINQKSSIFFFYLYQNFWTQKFWTQNVFNPKRVLQGSYMSASNVFLARAFTR